MGLETDDVTVRTPAVPLYLAFALTGVGVALPGALLPALLRQWHLGDEQGGQLFLMAWMGSSAGALLVAGSLRTRLVMGSLATALAAVLLGECGGHFADGWMLLYGLGLGMTMTAISLIRQQQTLRTGAEFVRLNLLWAIGACVCPSLTVRALTAGVIQPLLFGLAGCFAVFGVWAALQREVRLLPAPATAKSGGALQVFRAVPVGLIVMVMLITGIESSAGGWMATYARRGGHTVAGTIAATTCLWAGLLLSRLFWSVGDAWISKRMTQVQVVRLSVALMGVASVLLVASGSVWVVMVAAFLLGFGIGPVYPLLLAWALQFDRSGAIFFLAGVGSACLPWLTGVVSGRSGSLRVGLVVPMVGTMAMLAVAVVRPLVAWSAGRQA